jgi:hypothetical protein
MTERTIFEDKEYDYPVFFRELEFVSENGTLEDITVENCTIKNIPKEVEVFSYNEEGKIEKFFGFTLVKNVTIRGNNFLTVEYVEPILRRIGALFIRILASIFVTFPVIWAVINDDPWNYIGFTLTGAIFAAILIVIWRKK